MYTVTLRVRQSPQRGEPPHGAGLTCNLFSEKMRDPEIKIDPATLLLIVSVLLLVPLLIAGFFFQ
ncbi:hypothetical protein QUB80_07080 [Chlorogloeopsis sp. ULAP01]|uniref:hypothetical protein n=1 Tax=Chlorogloeopsis sp. ULAP01 TaxID=3056483 RepID=UPI0025AAC97F|nr:hypothetical protein [Chlorogloeopsis sp. ULAP01]MDM9380465.1 hypothetical protein [Chlorogloeopsis sp. ULAP01]